MVKVALVTPVFVKSKSYRQPGFIAQYLLFNLFLVASLFNPASADNNDGAKDLGVDCVNVFNDALSRYRGG